MNCLEKMRFQAEHSQQDAFEHAAVIDLAQMQDQAKWRCFIRNYREMRLQAEHSRVKFNEGGTGQA